MRHVARVVFGAANGSLLACRGPLGSWAGSLDSLVVRIGAVSGTGAGAAFCASTPVAGVRPVVVEEGVTSARGRICVVAGVALLMLLAFPLDSLVVVSVPLSPASGVSGVVVRAVGVTGSASGRVVAGVSCGALLFLAGFDSLVVGFVSLWALYIRATAARAQPLAPRRRCSPASGAGWRGVRSFALRSHGAPANDKEPACGFVAGVGLTRNPHGGSVRLAGSGDLRPGPSRMAGGSGMWATQPGTWRNGHGPAPPSPESAPRRSSCLGGWGCRGGASGGRQGREVKPQVRRTGGGRSD